MVLAESGLFTSIGGLPMHPLLVHFAVVILPLSALGLIAIVIKPSWARTFGWVVLAGLLVGAGASFIAKESGEALATYVGLPQEHADYGNVLPLVSVLLFLVAAVWFYLVRKSNERSALTTVLAVASVILALVATGLTIIVGHTGAQAAWAGRIPDGSASASTPTAAPGGASGSGAATGAITMADVAQHNSASDCWTVVDGNAYNVTDWISQHPGGPSVIKAMCGIDGSAAFDGQHAGQGRPAKELATFLLGAVAVDGAAAGASPTANASANGAGITMADVAQHNSASDCWTAVDGNAYNVTDWISQHPGGPGVIEAMCGVDGSGAFNGQHSGQQRPANELSQFLIGPIQG